MFRGGFFINSEFQRGNGGTEVAFNPKYALAGANLHIRLRESIFYFALRGISKVIL